MRERVTGEIDIPRDVRASLEEARARTGRLGIPLHWLSTTASTNDVAAMLAANGATEGTTVVAEAQTHGRGRHGRSWFSAPGAGLYMSIVLRPSAGPGLLTLAGGVAVAEAVRACTGLPAEIKWPNDVLVGGRKLAGILAEGATEAGRLQYVILGVGVNLSPAAYPPDLAAIVTSIEAETSRPADRAMLLAALLASLNEYAGHLSGRNFDAILTAWRALAPSMKGTVVEWDAADGTTRRGRIDDIDTDGALLVHDGAVLRRLVAGDVRIGLMRRSARDAARD